MGWTREQINEYLDAIGESALLFDGIDGALLGFGSRPGQPMLAVYDYNKIIDEFVNAGMTYEDAVEWTDYNIVGAWIGEQTPIIVMPLFD